MANRTRNLRKMDHAQGTRKSYHIYMTLLAFSLKAIVQKIVLALYLRVPSADNLCKQFGLRSRLIIHQARSGSTLFDTLMVFLKEFFNKVDFEKISRQQKSMQNFPIQ